MDAAGRRQQDPSRHRTLEPELHQHDVGAPETDHVVGDLAEDLSCSGGEALPAEHDQVRPVFARGFQDGTGDVVPDPNLRRDRHPERAFQRLEPLQNRLFALDGSARQLGGELFGDLNDAQQGDLAVSGLRDRGRHPHEGLGRVGIVNGQQNPEHPLAR